MQALGDTLREARMRQKIDIGEVEAKTKIRAKYLRALENEEFGALPGPTYVRSFLRTYAAFLGLDAQLLVEEYRVQHEPIEEPAEVQPLGGPPASPRRERRGPPPRGAVLGLAAAAVLVFLLVLGLTGGNEDSGSSKQAKKPAKTTPKRKQPAATAPAKPSPRRVTLRVVPQDPTYVCLDDGRGKIVFEGILQEARTFRGKRLRINLGKTSAKLRVNGRRVPIEPGSQPVGFAFTPRGGRKDLPAGQRPCA